MANTRKAGKTGKAKTEAADTRARVSVEGTEYLVTPEGLAKLNASHWYRKPGTPGAPAPVKAPTASPDRDVSAWVARLSSLMVAAAKRSKTDTSYHLGRACGDGYVLIATDGHRALCRRGDAPTPETSVRPLTMATAPARPVWFDASPALAVALKRMRAAGSAKSATTLTVSRSRKRVILSTRDDADGTVAQEWIPAVGDLRPVSVAVNTDYLLTALGLPGLRVCLNPTTNEPLILESADQLYRFVVMPVAKGVVKPIEALDRPAVAIDIPKDRPARSARAVAKRLSAASPVTEVPAVSVTAAPQTDDANLTAGQKAWRTRQARIADGAPPTDWVSAGRKAWETRMRNRQVAA